MGYQSRLTKDLDRWIASGWVDAGQRANILGDVASRPGRWSAAGALAILGATLLAMSALSFVAANWDAMPRLVRFATILAALWASLLGAGRAFDRQAPVIGHALALLGAALFGAAIMLTAQTFNMTSFRNTAILIWTVAAGAIAYTLPSRPVLILATLLGALWAGLEAFNPYAPGIIWSYLPVWALSMFLAWKLRSTVSQNLLALALLLWIGDALWTQEAAHHLTELQAFAAGILVTATLGLTAALARDKAISGAGILAGWAIAIAVFSAYLIQWPLDGGASLAVASGSALYPTLILVSLAVMAGVTTWRVTLGSLSWQAALAYLAAGLMAAALPSLVNAAGPDQLIWVRVGIGAVFYALAVALIIQGTRARQGLAGGIGIAAFVLQTLYVYAETFSGLLDTALFFLLGGVILFALSLVILRLRKGVAAKERAMPEAGS
tara:strand:+ start:1214 stop:2530 length:1317 start_codon:yes stop_codon:yes gene_type:complete